MRGVSNKHCLLTFFISFAYLDPQEVEDSFVFDILPDPPKEIAACERYADYLLSIVPLSADQLLLQLLMEQFDTLRIQCRHIEHMHEGVYNFCLHRFY